MKNELMIGDIVLANRDLDECSGEVVPTGTVGVVFAEENYHKDGCGPMVRFIMGTGRGHACNVYPGDVLRREDIDSSRRKGNN